MSNNKAALDKGFKKGKQIIYGYLYDHSIKFCDSLVSDALSKREYESFTGNTITSYACGIYIDGNLNYIVASGEDMAAPVHAKVQYGEYVFLEYPYEGKARGVRGKVNIIYDLSGMETSFRFLQGYKPNGKGISIIMTTGTEYSNYLESARKLNVLSDTAQEHNVKRLLYSSFKPLP